MIRSFLLSLGVSLAIAGSYFLAKVSDQWFQEQSFRLESSISKGDGKNDGALEALVLSNLEVSEEAALDELLKEVNQGFGVMGLEQSLADKSLDELEGLFIEAIARDLEERDSFEFAGLILEEIASENPAQGELLLNALSPAEREKLASAFAKGWASDDPLGAWDWITVGWMNPEGEYVDRSLQYDLFYNALDAVLTDRKEYQLAADLVRQEYEPELKGLLAQLIAQRVVSDNPSESMAKIDFDSDDEIDQAILDAIVDEWSQRDSLGSMDWALANEVQVSTFGVQKVTKQLLLNNAESELAAFHAGLENYVKKDAAAAEAGRLLARRDPDIAVEWLNAIVSAPSKQQAVKNALYELGHDDFSATVGLIDGVYDVREADRLPLVTDALLSWTKVDAAVVDRYLATGVEVYLPQTLDEFQRYAVTGL